MSRRPRHLSALTVDAWYTLLYITPAEHRALERRRWTVWSQPLLRRGAGRAEIRGWLARRERWCARLEAGGRTPPVAEQIRAVARWSGRPLDVDALAPALDRALLATEIRLAPGAGRALRELEGAGVPLGLVSNVLNESGAAARNVLARLGVLARFRAVVLSCEQPWAKPSPRPFRLACEFLGADPRRVTHLGDLAYDVRGARAAGLRAWWYTGLSRLNGYLPGQVDPRTVSDRDRVRSWSELPARFR